ncbi:MAG: urate hydroxylase PuuD [Thermoanaerobaculia bacterium]
MEPHVHEWLHLLLRWTHILAAIMWIGDSFLFMWLERALRPPDPPREGVTGETFMVHGGGYYRMEKRLFSPGQMPPVLHWFKWEAITTWASGLLLLIVVFYVGGSLMLVDTSAPHLPTAAAITVGLALLPVCWFLYDALWQSPLKSSTALAGAISLVLFTALSYGVTRVFIGRAAYMHVGAVLGTLMVMNVWVRILPNQRRMLAAVRRGEAVDQTPGLNAKKRSTHNTYMTLPVIFIMVSNHFPTTYGSRWNWIALVALSIAGALTRHFMLVRTKQVAWMLGAAAVIFAAVFYLTSRG